MEKQVPQVLIDVQGLAYEVQTSMTSFFRLPEVGDEVMLHTHFTVREDAQILYGFYEENERSLFKSLIKVNGVGPKLALTILSSIQPDSFVQCVRDKDSASLVRLPGVGKKTAERLIIEMQDKLSAWSVDASIAEAPQSDLAPAMNAEREAMSALLALGYKPQEASKMIAKLDITDLSSEDIIKQALKGMIKHD